MEKDVNYIMTEEVRSVILKYMYTRPYQEVAQGIAVLMQLPKLDPKINPSQNKKRERNAPLFITKVYINTDGNLIINHEYPNPKTILERIDDTHYKYIISSIVKHCMSESVNFDERLNKLLKQI